MSVEICHDKYLDRAIELLQRSDSTNRSHDTWRGNDMTAVLALDGDQVVGIIPFERRDIVGRNSRIIKALWVSGAHVDEEYRSHGLGSRMDQAISGLFSTTVDCVLVCRGDDQSAAHRWYRKNGYGELVKIISFKKEVATADTTVPVFCCDTLEAIEENADRIYDCFWRNNGDYCGFVYRDKQFWRKKYLYHYYKESYRYSVLALEQDGRMVACAFLGETQMRDDVRRYDLLELAVPESQTVRENLLAGIMNVAGARGLSELRLQMSGNDPARGWIDAMGFRQRWESQVMGKAIGSRGSLAEYFDIDRWRYFHVDYA